MNKNFVIIIKSINNESIEDNPIVIIKKHSMQPDETIDSVCYRYEEEIIDDYNLQPNDSIEIYPETKEMDLQKFILSQQIEENIEK